MIKLHFGILLNATFLMLSFLLISVNVYGQQTKCSVNGRVTDEKNASVAYASVAIYKGSTPIAGVITDNEGSFSLEINQSKEDYQLVIEFIGYTKHSLPITPDKNRISLGTIVLKEDAIMLEGASVSAKEISRKSSVEHTTINASANLASSKGTAIDILRSASSVSISNNEISIRGNSNILVLMDGVPTTATDLSTIPAGNIKSIEVITNPDASYDASGTGGIINIVSKKTSVEGLSGIIAANYGFNHFVTANAAISYNKPKYSYRFSYNTRYEDDVVNTSLYRKIKSDGSQINQQMQATRYVYNNNIGLGADFRINPRNRLSIDAKCIIPRLNVRQDLRNSIIEDAISSEESRHNDVTWNRETIEGSIAYTHIIKPEVSEISIHGSVSKIWGHRPSFYYIEGQKTNYSNSGGSPFITSLQADYKHKFKAGTLAAGAKLTYRSNDIYHRFYELNGEEEIYSEDLSNDLLHTETVPAAYAMFSSRIGRKFTYKAGLRGEMGIVTLNSQHETVDMSKNSFFLAPTLSGTYKLSKEQEFSFALSRRTGRPAYPQLNPYMSMVDANTFEQGNMHLNPEQSTKLDLSYNLSKGKSNLFVNVYVNHTKDFISQITMIDDTRLITTYVNAAYDLKSGADITFRMNPVRWFNLSVAANTYYSVTDGEFNGAVIANKGLTNNSNVMLDFLPWKGGDIQCQYFVTTPQYFPQLTTALTHQMNLGLRQKFMKGKMTVSLLLTDVFKTAKWEVSSHNNIFDLTNISFNKSRMLWLGVSYNFNSFKQKGGQKADNDRSLIKLGL